MSRQLVEVVLRDVFGEKAELVWEERTKRSPLNLVLAVVDRQLNAQHALCWVYNGTPELLSYPGFTPQTVVYSARYVELCGMLRMALMGPWEGPLKEEVLRRLLMKTVAELALRHGDPDFAVEAFLEASIGQGIVLLDRDKLLDLEHQPIDERYAAIWFFGLAHEYGHLFVAAGGGKNHAFEASTVEEIVRDALVAIDLPEAMRRDLLERAKNEPTSFCLGLQHLGEEGVCDAFACSVLLQSTMELMKKVGSEFRPDLFLTEVMLARFYVFALRQCRLLAELDSERARSRDKALDAALLPAALLARARLQRHYLEYAMAALYGEPSDERRQMWGNLIDKVEESAESTVAAFNAALGAVTRFVLKPESRARNEWQALDTFRREVAGNPQGPSRAVAGQFVEFAKGIAQGKMLGALERILANPQASLDVDPTGDAAFVVPFVVGNGKSRPFGLNTRHGHLVFVFVPNSPVYEVYFQQSAQALASGFALESVVVPVSRPEKLVSLLADRMPQGLQFALIIEGTEDFNRLMVELARDEIWD